MALEPQAFDDALQAWLKQVRAHEGQPEPQSAVAIDGKSLRGTQGVDQRAKMLVTAFDPETACVLRQLVVPEETNEQKAALRLLKELVLTGRIATMDALHCQQETCQQIVDSEGDYVIPVKENQPTLLNTISREFTAENAAFSPLQPA